MTSRDVIAVSTMVVMCGACASTQWRKPGVSEAERARDVEACGHEARDRSLHELNARLLSRPYGTGIDPQGNATLAPPLSAEGERLMIEQRLMRNCMLLRGYEAVREPAGER